MPNPLPSPETLRKLLRYEPETGKLFWRERGIDWFEDGGHTAQHNMRSWNSRYAGKEALTAVNTDGYRRGTIFGTRYYAHRIIWTIVHGEWPQDELDHINGNPSDNRLENLRVVTHQENGRNQKLYCSNTSGVVGVSWHKRDETWRAEIKVDGKKIHLGYFDSFDDAVAARAAAEIELGFHANHGRVA